MRPTITTRRTPYRFSAALTPVAIASNVFFIHGGSSRSVDFTTSANVRLCVAGCPFASRRLWIIPRCDASVSRQPRPPQPHSRLLPGIGVCPISPLIGSAPW